MKEWYGIIKIPLRDFAREDKLALAKIAGIVEQYYK